MTKKKDWLSFWEVVDSTFLFLILLGAMFLVTIMIYYAFTHPEEVAVNGTIVRIADNGRLAIYNDLAPIKATKFYANDSVLMVVKCYAMKNGTELRSIHFQHLNYLTTCAQLEATPELWHRYNQTFKNYNICYMVDNGTVPLGKCEVGR